MIKILFMVMPLVYIGANMYLYFRTLQLMAALPVWAKIVVSVFFWVSAFSLFAAVGLRNIFGGRSGSYERELLEARASALKELEERARERGADAVVGIDIDYEVLGPNGGMLMVTASGTAVKLG